MSADEECVLTGSGKDEFLIVMSSHGLVPEEEGREVRGHTTLSRVLRGEGSGELLLATCRSAGSSSSYQERDGTSVSGLGWGQHLSQLESVALWPQAAGELARASSFVELITQSPDPFLCSGLSPAAGSPLHLNQSHPLPQTNARIS